MPFLRIARVSTTSLGVLGNGEQYGVITCTDSNTSVLIVWCARLLFKPLGLNCARSIQCPFSLLVLHQECNVRDDLLPKVLDEPRVACCVFLLSAYFARFSVNVLPNRCEDHFSALEDFTIDPLYEVSRGTAWSRECHKEGHASPGTSYAC